MVASFNDRTATWLSKRSNSAPRRNARVAATLSVKEVDMLYPDEVERLAALSDR